MTQIGGVGAQLDVTGCVEVFYIETLESNVQSKFFQEPTSLHEIYNRRVSYQKFSNASQFQVTSAFQETPIGTLHDIL